LLWLKRLLRRPIPWRDRRNGLATRSLRAWMTPTRGARMLRRNRRGCRAMQKKSLHASVALRGRSRRRTRSLRRPDGRHCTDWQRACGEIISAGDHPSFRWVGLRDSRTFSFCIGSFFSRAFFCGGSARAVRGPAICALRFVLLPAACAEGLIGGCTQPAFELAVGRTFTTFFPRRGALSEEILVSAPARALYCSMHVYLAGQPLRLLLHRSSYSMIVLCFEPQVALLIVCLRSAQNNTVSRTQPILNLVRIHWNAFHV
jgi:hypothetical protein